MKKTFIVNISIIKNITGTRISRTVNVKMRSYPGAITVVYATTLSQNYVTNLM